jgi:hypothetical protein
MFTPCHFFPFTDGMNHQEQPICVQGMVKPGFMFQLMNVQGSVEQRDIPLFPVFLVSCHSLLLSLLIPLLTGICQFILIFPGYVFWIIFFPCV